MGFIRKDDNDLYPILSWENNIVTNNKYSYGDIRRYGAKCDGVTDDSNALQIALDYCSPNNITVYIPEDKITLISSSIVLKDNYSENWKYKIESSQENPKETCIYQTCKNLFVGEKFYNTPATFTNIKISMKSVNIKCTETINCIVFKALNICSSFIENCKFYFPYVFIEGALSIGTIFTRNRIQGFRYAVISSISIINNEHDYDYINETYKSSGYTIDSLSDLLVQNPTSSTTYAKYHTQCNDGYFDHNYISGKTSKEQLPKAVFSIETIDSDFIIEKNWFEFCKYVISPNIRTNSSGNTNSLMGCHFNNNVFQYFFRFFNPDGRYSTFTLYNNLFYAFSKDKLINLFTNTTDTDITTMKCGIIVGDYTESRRPYIANLILNNNYFVNNDYTIYFDNGNSGTSFTLTCRETNSVFENNKNKQFIRLRNNQSRYESNYFECLDNKTVTDTTISTSISNTNTFNNQIVRTDSTIYISVWSNDRPILVPFVNINQINTTANRPSSPYIGQQYFDTDLGKPIWYDGTNWVDSSGTII